MDDKGRKVLKSIAMITQIPLSMMVPVFLCAAIGTWLDRLFNTQFCFLVFIVIGIGAAFRNVYILTKSFYAADMEKEHDKIKYIQDLKDYSKTHPEEAQKYTETVKTKRYPGNRGQKRKQEGSRDEKSKTDA